MKFMRLIFKNARRNPVRTFITLSALFAVMALLTFMLALSDTLSIGVELAANTRIVTRHRTSLQLALPTKYLPKLEAIPHVQAVTRANWFGGIYKHPRNFFSQLAIDPDKFSGVWPECRIPEEQLKAWTSHRTGCIVGRQLAKKYGWKIGDKIPLIGTIYRANLDLTLDGIYTGSNEQRLFFHWKYLDELIGGKMSWVWIYWMRVDKPDHVAETCEGIDAMFINSDAATRTEAEAAFNLTFVSMMGNIPGLIRNIGFAVIAMMVLVAANTMAMSIRERTTEVAILKTLGFSRKLVMGLVIGESTLISAIGGFAGILLAVSIITLMRITGIQVAIFPYLMLTPQNILLGVAVTFLVGISSGILPAWRSASLNVVEGLRRVA